MKGRLPCPQWWQVRHNAKYYFKCWVTDCLIILPKWTISFVAKRRCMYFIVCWGGLAWWPMVLTWAWSPRWPEAHHQAEAVGAAGGAGGQVRVAQRGGRLLRRIPAPHAGPGPWEEGHGGRMPTTPLAHHLVAPCRHCTSLFLLLLFSRDCNRSLSSLGISDKYLFLSFLFCYLVLIIGVLLICMFRFLCVCSSLCLYWWRGDLSDFVTSCLWLAPAARTPHPPTSMSFSSFSVMLVAHPCLVFILH